MSKRHAFNAQFGERKKPKLDVSVTDHHFPLSQNPSSSNKENDFDNWGDDIEDEMLLEASQVCEQAINDTSFLPDYAAWKQPSSTSTQYQPSPSTSKVPTSNKAPFIFKKPNSNPPNTFSTHPISSPLPGIATKFVPESKGLANITDDLVINGKASGQDDYIYRQLLQLKEENEKLKSDNDKLLEKCVTKDGEASILRTQLKSSQQAVDNARMEKTRAQENVKMEYTEKLAAVNSQLSDLRTQLEFKSLEIISVKEKCKKMESGKLKLTQVTVPSNDISYRNNSVSAGPYVMTQSIKKETTSSNVQTEKQAPFLKLNKSCAKGASKMSAILPQLLEPTQQQHSISEYNENLQKHTDYSQHKRTYHRIPSTPAPKQEVRETITDNSIHELLACLVKDPHDFGKSRDKCFQLFSIINDVLATLQHNLEDTSKCVTTAFLREMDERYIEASGSYIPLDVHQLLEGKELYKDEQGIRARRLLAILGMSLETPSVAELFHQFQEETAVSILDTAIQICELIDLCSCGIHYSGFLLSLTYLFETLLHHSPTRYGTLVATAIRSLVSCRGSNPLSLETLTLVRATALLQASEELPPLCRRKAPSELKVDHDQGVLLYTKDSCYFQVLLKQTEASLKCIEKQDLVTEALKTMESLTALYGNLSSKYKSNQEEEKCQCLVMLVQTLVYCLRICAVMLTNQANKNNNFELSKLKSKRMLGACRSGVQALYLAWLRGGAASARLAAAGLLRDGCDRLARLERDELYYNMLSELSSAPAMAEDPPPSFNAQPWLLSFENFSMTD